MATRDTPFAAGTPCWVDLLTSDLSASRDFYAGLFGWQFEDSDEEFGNYSLAQIDGKNVSGLMPRQPGMDAPDTWTTYISTDDLDATLERVSANGGTIVAPAMDVGDLGRMAIVIDPAGAAVGLWQPGQHTGFGRYNEAGAVTWDEHHSKDFAASTAFYEAVFGWTYDPVGDSDEFRYYTAKVDGGEEAVAGLSDSKSWLPDEVPSHWTLYFSVEDCDEAQAKALELGAQLVRSAEDSPFGRMADLCDPGGVNFKLHSVKLANPPADDDAAAG